MSCFYSSVLWLFSVLSHLLLSFIFFFFFFFFNDTATTEIYTLSLHDALPISDVHRLARGHALAAGDDRCRRHRARAGRSEEHTSELQSQSNLVCRLLLEKKKKHTITIATHSPTQETYT